MGCCGVSVKEDLSNNNPSRNQKYNQNEQINPNNNNNNNNSTSINVYKNPLKTTKDSIKRDQTPLTHTNLNQNANTSMEYISLHSTIKKKEEPKKPEKVKTIKNINILDNVKEYLPDDITRDEIEEMVKSAIGDSISFGNNYKKGANLTREHVEALIDIIYMNVVGRNNGDKNYEKIMEDVRVKVGFVDVSKDSVKNIMFRRQNPTDDEIEQVLEQFKLSIDPKLFVIELLD